MPGVCPVLSFYQREENPVMTIEMIQSVLVVLVFLALAVERGVELFRPIFSKIPEVTYWQATVKISISILLGVFVSALLRLDILAMLGLSLSPAAGYVAAGVLASAGASPWHALLEWLKSIKDGRNVPQVVVIGDVEPPAEAE